jgi:hypothetical protein
MNKIVIFIPVALILAFAQSDTTNSGFFQKLEQELRADYTVCTGDSTRIPVKELIRWKHWNDSMTALPDFPAAQKAYQAETGNSAVTNRPCAVLAWKRVKDSIATVKARAAEAQKKSDADATAESLAVCTEIASLTGRPVLLEGIPFGASRRAFFWQAARQGFGPFNDQGSYLACNRVPLGKRTWLGAFYFDTLGLCRFELEGPPHGADSLDEIVRPDVEMLASHFETIIGGRPHRTFRVSRDEIKPDEIAIVKAWSHSTWSVVIGLSRHGYRYFAKVVATNRPLKPGGLY